MIKQQQPKHTRNCQTRRRWCAENAFPLDHQCNPEAKRGGCRCECHKENTGHAS